MIFRQRFAFGWGEMFRASCIWSDAKKLGLRVTPEHRPYARIGELLKVYDIEVEGDEASVAEFIRLCRFDEMEQYNINELAASQGLPADAGQQGVQP